MMDKAGQLTLVERAESLIEVVLIATEKSPKKYRFTFSARMQNMAFDILEHVYFANEVFVQSKQSYELRRSHQNKVLTNAKLLVYMAKVAERCGAILPKQFGEIAQLTVDIKNMTGGWIKSDEKRYYQLQQRRGTSV